MHPMNPLVVRERFHLLALRHLGQRLAGRRWAVKGGICLRFFHGSPRFSLDMDLDVAPSVRSDTLRKAVEGGLASRSLAAALAPAGVNAVRFSAAKQTAVTQRWKVALELGAGNSVPTKLEFSRRADVSGFTAGMPSGTILEAHGLPSFVAQYYGGDALAAQKIRALASPMRSACRDIFDLHHLFSRGLAVPDRVGRIAGREDCGKALGKAESFSMAAFRAEVAPFLPEDLAGPLEKRGAIEKMTEELRGYLAGMVR
jgi:hypothetical protein